jgi:hypothetical protein
MQIRTKWISHAALLFIGVSSVAVSGQALSGPVSVNIEIPKNSYKIGESISLTLVTSNVSNQEIFVPVSPGVTDATFTCVASPSRGQNDTNINDFSERSSKRHTRSSFAYSLAPNTNLKRKYDLSRRYNFDSPGQYSTTLRCFYSKNSISIEADSNSVSFSVVP